MISKASLAFLPLVVTANELFLQDKTAATPKVIQSANSDDSSSLWYSLDIGIYLSYFGIDSFTCTNPSFASGDFDVTQLEGTWFQAYANLNTDVFGCLSYQFVLDSSKDRGDLPAFNLQTSWTAFNTWWNPLEKG